MLIPYLLFFAGLIFIVKGGDLFVDSATWMAKITGLPEVLIGATIVSIATTIPEATVSVISAIQNETSMAMGNAIGSIICNTGLILGLCNFIKPSKINSKIFYSKGFLLLVYLILFLLIASKGNIEGISSMILLSMLAVYILFNIEEAYRNKNRPSEERGEKIFFTKKEALIQMIYFILGAVFILVGANLLVNYGIVIARYWGVPSAIISLTLIALGTSLPELITAISSLRKGHGALSLGNILGANILNITMVIGVSSLFNPLPVNVQVITMDIPVALILNALLVIPTLFTKSIARPQAISILLGYLLYIGFLFIFH